MMSLNQFKMEKNADSRGFLMWKR